MISEYDKIHTFIAKLASVNRKSNFERGEDNMKIIKNKVT
jgi:hypothetical protein